ncbi:DUF3465 domain-containing protein [Microbacterium sp. 22242]|uniref:DUF3465 domain-containing protein n=1 Tax=Microbacterium sp. 22242 TaxID=3453896 RepID=UPI003F8281BF
MARKGRWGVIVAICALAAIAVLGSAQQWFGTVTDPPATVGTAPASGSASGSSADPVRALFDGRRSGVEVQGRGVVSRILSDDDQGSRHQRFLLTTPGGVTILIAHNIDIAPRLDGLSVGDTVEFLGDYEWSEKGGTVHWTHHDPSGQHQRGWLQWNGRTYA